MERYITRLTSWDIYGLPVINHGSESDILKFDEYQCFKYFKADVDFHFKEQVVNHLMIKNSLSGILTIPLSKVYDEQDYFIGYLMKIIKGLTLSKWYKKHRSDKTLIVQTILDISYNIRRIHNEHITMGDINDTNIMINENVKNLNENSSFFIDSDGGCVDDIGKANKSKMLVQYYSGDETFNPTHKTDCETVLLLFLNYLYDEYFELKDYDTFQRSIQNKDLPYKLKQYIHASKNDCASNKLLYLDQIIESSDIEQIVYSKKPKY